MFCSTFRLGSGLRFKLPLGGENKREEHYGVGLCGLNRRHPCVLLGERVLSQDMETRGERWWTKKKNRKTRN